MINLNPIAANEMNFRLYLFHNQMSTVQKKNTRTYEQTGKYAIERTSMDLVYMGTS